MSSRLPPITLFFAALVLTSGARAGGEWSAHVGLELGADSNPGRRYGTLYEPAALVSGMAGLEGRWQGTRWRLSGDYDVGARWFPTQASESTIAQRARGEVGYWLHPSIELVLSGAGKDRRGQREYTDLRGQLGVRWHPDAQLSVALLAGAEGFWYRLNPELDFFAPGATLEVRYRFDRRHHLSLFGEGGERRHRGLARERDLSEPFRPRFDALMAAGATYGFRGPLIVSVGYDVLSLQSNSFGESLLRHRVTGRLGLPLFWELTLFGDLALQLARYPDGIYASPQLFLLEDAENQNALTLELNRPLDGGVELALRYGIFQNRLAGNDLRYLRQIVTFGVSWRR